jgi:hypothetical protein
MARSLPNALHAARRKLRQTDGWLLFLEVALRSGKYARLVKNEQHLQADGRTWQAANIRLELPEEDSEGNLGQLLVRVPNVSREALRLVEVEDDVLGCPCTAWLQNVANLTTFEPALSWEHVILDAEVDEKTATFLCGHAAELVKCPGPLIDRQRFPQVLPGMGVRL